MSNELIKPHGKKLVNCYCDPSELNKYKSDAINYSSYTLSDRQLCDLELILNGAFSPINGFMNQEDYNSVLENNRLSDGTVWPMPIVLDMKIELAKSVNINDKLALRDKEGYLIAILNINDKWDYDKTLEAKKVYGTTDITHTGVRYIFENGGDICLGGKVIGVEHPHHHDFLDIRLGPVETRKYFKKNAWDKVVAFQTRNPMHRAHKEIMQRAAEEIDGKAFLHPVVGMTKQGDVDYFTRVRCYQKIIKKFPKNSTALGLLPLSMRMAGPREALWHAIIRKNYGCTHFIIGRDHAGPGNDKNGKPFYGPYEAQELVKSFESELDIKMVMFKMVGYHKNQEKYVSLDDPNIDKNDIMFISGTQLREKLNSGEDIPDWFTYSDITDELRKTYPPKLNRGFTIFFTGLSGSGKSTIAKSLYSKLMEIGSRPVTLLDGDIVRTHLSSELGFSKEHRNLNIRRIGFVASEITKNRGAAICAPIAPYEESRNYVKEIISQHGEYILVHVSTSLEVCQKRDTKGLYRKAKEGLIKGLTGVDDPYQVPKNADIIIDTDGISVADAVDNIIIHLKRANLIN
ncbi:MAG: adenylyltransferase [Candidatus Marinimicrobia bacterium]|nr:adenylyltransferase [Candidatus Neomarinimicrobiota bacterium]